jgi:ParB family chromosome partitioning protein
MAERRRLGRGLDSLIPALDAEAGAEGGTRDIPLKKIELNPDQPRFEVDPEELERLADSIRAAGVIQPVVVRPAGEMFELVVGERRVRAARMAGLEEVPAVVREVPDERMLELALVENIQRADLNPIEKAEAIRRMIRELDLTQEEAGSRLGLDRSTIANLLRLLDLAEEVKGMVSRGTISAGHARALLAVDAEAARLRLAKKVASKGLSVRATEQLASQAAGRRAERIRQPSPNVVQLEEGLSRALGARAEIKLARSKGGKIVIHFADHDDFERLYELITGTSTTEEEYPQRIPA